MNSLTVSPQKKKIFSHSKHSSWSKKSERTSSASEERNFVIKKPNFLYFTQRDRQKINFFEMAQPETKKEATWQNDTELKIESSFQKNFKVISRNFHSKNRSLHQNNSICSKCWPTFYPKDFLFSRKSKVTLRKKAFKYKNEEHNIGVQNLQPEGFMRKISTNETFRRGKSCHIPSSNSTLNKQNLLDLLVKSSFSFQTNHQKSSDEKNFLKQKITNNCPFNSLIVRQNKIVKEGPKENISISKVKPKIKCFDMGKQTSRIPYKSRSNKISETCLENEYIEKNYKKQILTAVPMNSNELAGFYDRQKKKYRIQKSSGILKDIKLEDFIKIHLNETSVEDQNFD